MKLLGPVQAYVAPGIVDAVRLTVTPAQYGPPFPAVGAAGIALTVALVVPAGDVQPLTLTLTL